MIIMRRIVTLSFLLLATTVLAGFGGFGQMGAGFGKLGTSSGGHAAPPLTGKLLLENGSSFLLLEDGSSKLCFQGGC